MKQLIKPILTLVIGFVLLMVGYALNGGSGPYDAFFMTWIICGIPYGLPKIRLWFSMRGGNLGTAVGIFVLNFILAGLIGGFIYVWTMCKAIVTIVSFCFNRSKEIKTTPLESTINQEVENA